MRSLMFLALCGTLTGCQMPTSPRVAQLDALLTEGYAPAPRPPIVKTDESEGVIHCEAWVLQPIVIDGVTYYEYVNQCL